MAVRWRLRFWGGYVLSRQWVDASDLRVGDIAHLPSSPQQSWAGVSGNTITSIRGKVNVTIESPAWQWPGGLRIPGGKHKVPRSAVAHVLRDGIIYRVKNQRSE